MGRRVATVSASRTVSSADTNTQLPGNPTGTTVPAGVCSISGAGYVAIDISSTSTTAGNFTVQLLVWDNVLGVWVNNGDLTIAGMDTLPTPRAISPRTYVNPIIGDWAFVFFKALATNTATATATITAAVELNG